MSSTKKWKVVLRNDRDDPYESVLSLACSNSTRFRQPIVLKPGIVEQSSEGNEVIQRWGLPTPCECEARENTADVIVSDVEFWKPSALLKMLDLRISQFYWSTSTHNMEFCFKRSWNFLRVTLDKRALTHHIHDDGRWQLLGSEHLGIEEICTLEDHHKENWHECHITKSDRMLAEKLGQSLPSRKELLREFEFEFYITMKDGHWIDIDELETAGRHATVADKRSISKQVSVQSGSDIEIETVTTNAGRPKKLYPPNLPRTNTRKRVAE
ncbi:hypothetical protein BOTNAR_0141g00240 [Botryotinia narcissicola]|uniref:Uncharacterized protein n=1 Tax=Botryotinia narcissicola TaxID=278944 RepID=A0A4Z1IGI3_9HELO|nr:hypothetical protein BOTNAR_0141g00240 [Botryotinia narcissicola]